MSENLTDRTIKESKPRAKPYLMPDGRGLYLKVQPGGSRSWLLRYWSGGRDGQRSIAHDFGLGTYPEVGLAAARQKALEARRARGDGNDPIEARQAQRLGRGSKRPRA